MAKTHALLWTYKNATYQDRLLGKLNAEHLPEDHCKDSPIEQYRVRSILECVNEERLVNANREPLTTVAFEAGTGTYPADSCPRAIYAVGLDPSSPASAKIAEMLEARGGRHSDEGNIVVSLETLGLLEEALVSALVMKVACEGGEHRTILNIAKHETLFQNEPVLAAGEMWVDGGTLQALNDKSGTYHTHNIALNEQFLGNLLRAIGDSDRESTICAADVLKCVFHTLPRAWPKQLIVPKIV